MKSAKELFTNKRLTFRAVGGKVAIKKQTFAATATEPEREVTTLQGYPVLYSTPDNPQTSSDRGGYVVRIAPNAAKFSTPTLAVFNHDDNFPLGTTFNGTLRVMDADKSGVPVEIDLNMDTTQGQNTAAMVGRGDVSGMSFSMANGFEKYDESEETGPDGAKFKVITCTAFTCDEVSVVTRPAFTGTSVGVKLDDDDDEESAGGMSAATPARIAASARLNRLRLDMI